MSRPLHQCATRPDRQPRGSRTAPQAKAGKIAATCSSRALPGLVVLLMTILPQVAPAAGPLPAGQVLLCQGKGIASFFKLPFEPNANPAPTLGAICADSSNTALRGTVVAGAAASASKAGFAVVLGPPPAADGTAASGTAANGTPPPSTGKALLCQGKGIDAAFKLPFKPNASPAPTLGAACEVSGNAALRGTVVLAAANSASNIGFAVVVGPPPASGGTAAGGTAAGGNAANGATANGNSLVCRGTRKDGTAFNLAFEPNANPAPTAGASCAPSGKTSPQGTVVMGRAPKAPKVFASVVAPATNGAAAGNGAHYACKFTAGKLKGQTLTPTSVPLMGPVGAECVDNFGSTGRQVAIND